jgi:hypothetical protein
MKLPPLLSSQPLGGLFLHGHLCHLPLLLKPKYDYGAETSTNHFNEAQKSDFVTFLKNNLTHKPLVHT